MGVSHHAVFELAQAITIKPGAKLTLSLKQLSGKSHLIGLFKLSATDEPAARAAAMPMPAQEALGLPADRAQRSPADRARGPCPALRCHRGVGQAARARPGLCRGAEGRCAPRRRQRHTDHGRETEDRAGLEACEFDKPMKEAEVVP